MGGIAASDHPSRVETYRDVIVASAAFPGFFKPVYVRHSGSQGKGPILLRSFMVEGKQKKKTVCVLINGKLSLTASDSTPVAATVLDISKRSIAELMRGLTCKTIYQAYVTTWQARGQFRILPVPDDVQDISDGLRFRPAEMRRRFEIGRKVGMDPSNWQKEPPRLEPLERIEASAARQK